MTDGPDRIIGKLGRGAAALAAVHRLSEMPEGDLGEDLLVCLMHIHAASPERYGSFEVSLRRARIQYDLDSNPKLEEGTVACVRGFRRFLELFMTSVALVCVVLCMSLPSPYFYWTIAIFIPAMFTADQMASWRIREGLLLFRPRRT